MFSFPTLQILNIVIECHLVKRFTVLRKLDIKSGEASWWKSPNLMGRHKLNLNPAHMVHIKPTTKTNQQIVDEVGGKEEGATAQCRM